MKHRNFLWGLINMGEAYNIRPVKVVGNDEEEDSTGDEEEGVAVDRDGWGVPL